VAIDRDKVTQTAQKYVEKKKYDKAVVEYQKLVQADPNDARTLLKIGDLQLKMGAHEQAISTYETVGNLYAKQGWALKAIAVYKQIREIIAKHVPQLEDKYAHIAPKLAELYQQLGLTSDALAALDEVATRLQRQQRDPEAIEVFQKIVTLDPTNPLPHLRLAEALSRGNDKDGAVFEFKTAAAQLAGLGRRDDALKVLERLLHHKQDHEQARIAAELYLSRGQQQDGMQALSKLQICFQANPRDLDTLALLARAFNAIGQAAKAIEVQKEMARIARDAGKTDMAREILERLVRLAPHDEQVRKMAYGSVPAPPPPAAIVHPSSPQMAAVGRPQAPGYPPPPPAAMQRPMTANSAFSPQQPPPMPASATPYRAPAASGPVVSQEAEDEVEELSYEDAESIDDQAELVEDDESAAQGYEGEQQGEQQVYQLDDSGAEYAEEQQQDGYGGQQQQEQAYADGTEAQEGYAEEQPAYEGEQQQDGYGDQQAYEGEQQYAEEQPQEQVEQYAAGGEDVGAQLAQILADAQAFKRVRLYSKAVETLRAGLDIEPRSMDIREALRDTLLEAGQNEEAIYEMLAIAGLYIDALDGESAARALQDVLALDVTNQRAIEMLQELGYEIVDESEQQAVEETDAGEGNAYASQTGEERLPSYDVEEMGPRDVSPEGYADDRRVRRSQPPPAAAAADDGGSDNAPLPSFPLDEQEQQQYEEEEAPETHAPSTRPGTTDAEYAANEQYNNGAAEFADDTGADYAAVSAEDVQEEEEAAPSTAGAPGGHPDLEEALEESEFFVSRGLYEDARAILADHFARHPRHPLLRERLAEIDAQLAEMRGQGGSGARERPTEDRSFDIAAGLDSIEAGAPPQQSFREADEQVDVEEVFKKFKAGVAAQISPEDSESHENLGIAYKEMGLVDDAIREFEMAAHDPKKECVVCFNIGMAEMERGRTSEAIQAFIRGVNAQERSPQQETMLNYEIGNAYESMKQNRDALNYFQKTMRRDPNYRDVQERVRRLSKPEPSKPAPIKAAVGADDEFDRAFDDLLGGKS
jgi:tetratricopeptide (TPR) repeat protein